MTELKHRGHGLHPVQPVLCMSGRERGKERESMCLPEITRQTWTNVVQQGNYFPLQKCDREGESESQRAREREFRVTFRVTV